MRRPSFLLVPGVLLMAAMTASAAHAPITAAAPIADAPITYCADPDTDPTMDTGAGTMISCVTVITNTITAIDPDTGVASGTATVDVTECVGPSNGRLDPNDLTCSTDEQNLTELVDTVDQCNGVGYGGGNVLECSVTVVNEFMGVTPQAITAATVNQCNGSAPDTTGCNPFPATTTGATITQCNGSSYGGGQEDFDCIATGTTTATLDVEIDQCNDSNYGGGSWLTCLASVTNTIITVASPSPSSPAPTAGSDSPTANPTPPETSTDAMSGTAGDRGFGTALLGAAFLMVCSLIALQRSAVARHRPD